MRTILMMKTKIKLILIIGVLKDELTLIDVDYMLTQLVVSKQGACVLEGNK